MPKTRAARSLASTLVVLGATAVLAGGPRLLTPEWTPDAPSYRKKGAADPVVVIAEFSDFQCPACSAAAPHLKAILELFPDKVGVVFKHRAWDFHPHAVNAGVAAECAGKAGRFWDYHDKLFSTQPAWSVMESTGAAAAYFQKTAEEMGLEGAAFAACVKDPATAELVAADIKEAGEKWVNSTPTFVIGGRRFVGSNQLRTLGLNRVEDLLKKKS